jgi:hypothetical protein
VDVDDPHVIPSDEADQHATISCRCGATTEAVTRANGSTAWLVIHRSFSGREMWKPR